LRATGKPYVIENVPGAPLESPTLLCGSMFGLDVRRHRHFETNWTMLAPDCQHGLQRARKFIVRESKSRVGRVSSLVSVAGNDTHVRRSVVPVYGNGGGKGGIELWREVMEMPWASRYGIAQAIPPVYAEMIGYQLISQISPKAVSL
jgi:DNA (cytosine-5)-methyltransferase 1